MARPSPAILKILEVSPEIQLELTEAETVYAVLYRGEPASLRTRTATLDGYTLKYHRMTYTNEGSARAAAKRLNEKFKTEDFSYAELTV